MPIFLQNPFAKNNFQKFSMNLGWWNFRINISIYVIESIKIVCLMIVDVYEVFDLLILECLCASWIYACWMDYFWINHLLNVWNHDSYIKLALEMFRDHEMVSGLLKFQPDSKLVQRSRNQAASRLKSAQTREQAASRLPPSG